MKNCPPRVLINPRHPLCESLAAFASKASSENALESLRELKLMLDSLSDGVIENDHVTVARERWRTIQSEFRRLLGGDLPETVYETLVVRRH
jgi:predicted ArsR family transcriptional regulator